MIMTDSTGESSAPWLGGRGMGYEAYLAATHTQVLAAFLPAF
jgi:hypothetical protein